MLLLMLFLSTLTVRRRAATKLLTAEFSYQSSQAVTDLVTRPEPPTFPLFFLLDQRSSQKIWLYVKIFAAHDHTEFTINVQEIDELTLNFLPSTVHGFRAWQRKFEKEVVPGSGRPKVARPWII